MNTTSTAITKAEEWRLSKLRDYAGLREYTDRVLALDPGACMVVDTDGVWIEFSDASRHRMGDDRNGNC